MSGSSFCFMGLSSNSKVFLSDKDLKGSNNMDPEMGLLVRPSIEIHNQEFQSLIREDHHDQLIRLKQLSVQERDHHHDQHQEEQQKQRNAISLKIEIPSHVGSKNDDSTNEGLKTPTSSDHKIPVILECPGAPRKAKTKPATKRKACRQRVVLDLSKDLESLLDMPCAVDLGRGVISNKRVKQS
ncbi:hypothetical protein Fmac_019708 [Flemingia macrophylla]|uniref:Uncharacterized protein n=1 Tax=Flemingia macrophylla TaxID=520843 RepID=A0ABD1M8K5_9FABA